MAFRPLEESVQSLEARAHLLLKAPGHSWRPTLTYGLGPEKGALGGNQGAPWLQLQARGSLLLESLELFPSPTPTPIPNQARRASPCLLGLTLA